MRYGTPVAEHLLHPGITGTRYCNHSFFMRALLCDIGIIFKLGTICRENLDAVVHTSVIETEHSLRLIATSSVGVMLLLIFSVPVRSDEEGIYRGGASNCILLEDT
jgi:hypothetical protein